MTEKNIVVVVDVLTPFQFCFDEAIQDYYETIKSWSKLEVESQFFITNFSNQNFQKHITSDLGLETAIGQSVVNDRSIRYQYFIETPKNPGETLSEYLANRSKSKIWVDKKQHTLTELVKALVDLKRLPLLVIFDTVVNDKYYENLLLLKEALENNNLTDSVGVYFRLSNDGTGKQFNNIISDNKFNHVLDENTTVAALMSGKLPKFFIKNTWKPMSVITLDSRMGMRHGKTAVYSNCCDLIIEWADEPSLAEHKFVIS